MAPKPLPAIAAIEPYRGGESVLPGIAKPTKLASNENPFGPSPKAKAAFAAAAEKLHLYPEGSARILREAIAARYGLDAARIICGAGSDEIFFLLARAFLEPGDEIVVPEHSFSIYAIAAQQSGAIVRVAPAGMTADVDEVLALVTPRTKIVFLANPNNPTGTYLSFAEVNRLHAGLPDDVLLVIDAAYAEYVRRNDYSSGLELAAETENVIMTRTFSKIYGMASARLGWGYGPPVVIDALNRTRGPFNISVPGMMAGVAAIEDQEFLEKSVAHNSIELPRVTAALEALGLDVTPSVCNFVLVHFRPGQASEADAHLRKRGFILRGMRGYGLPDALRMSIGTTEQNDGALAALKEFLAP
jgi:histidinol-phosphate aminotransferase